MITQRIPDPDTEVDPTPPETEGSVPQPRTRAEWRALIEARCRERNITLNKACTEIGISGNAFSPTQIGFGIGAGRAAKLQQWLDRDANDLSAAAGRQARPPAPIQFDKSLRADIPCAAEPPPGIEAAPPVRYHTEEPLPHPLPYEVFDQWSSQRVAVVTPPPAPARAPRLYPAINIEPSAMSIDELILYLEQLRDLMPGATVEWFTGITISSQKA